MLNVLATVVRFKQSIHAYLVSINRLCRKTSANAATAGPLTRFPIKSNVIT